MGVKDGRAKDRNGLIRGVKDGRITYRYGLSRWFNKDLSVFA